MRHRLNVRTTPSVAAGLLLFAFSAGPVGATLIFRLVGTTQHWVVRRGVKVGVLPGVRRWPPGSPHRPAERHAGHGRQHWTGTFVVSIYDDLGGVPGALLTDLAGEAAPNLAGQYTYTPSGPLLLNADTTYYAVASVIGGVDAYAWNWIGEAAPAVGSGVWGYNAGGGWLTYPDYPMRMRVDAEELAGASPEPGTGLLMGVGLMGLVAVRRRQGWAVARGR